MIAKTLADFRVAHGAGLEHLLVDSFAALLQKALAVTEALHAQSQARTHKQAERAARKSTTEAATRKEREKEPRGSTTDAEARVMKIADGGFHPAYNV